MCFSSPRSPGTDFRAQIQWNMLATTFTDTLEQPAGFTASVRHDSRPVQETAEDSFV